MCQCIVKCGLMTGPRSAEGIMASGHANRANRPNTWLHRPATRREVLTCHTGAVHTWHIADIHADYEHVRFERNNGHDADVTRCLLMTHSGRWSVRTVHGLARRITLRNTRRRERLRFGRYQTE